MKEKTAISAAHHGESEPDEPAGLIAQFVRNPVALGDGGGIEQNGGDLGVGRALKPTVERAQCVDEPIAPLGGEHTEVGARRATGQAAPHPERGGDADVEKLVERKENRDGCPDLTLAVKPQARSAQFNDLIVVSDSENGLEAARVEFKSRIGEAVREFRQGHHTRERLGRPERRVSRGI